MKPYIELQLQDPFMFGKVMADIKNCEGFLEALLNERIEVVRSPQREKFIQVKKQGKYVQMDLHVGDVKQRIFDAEMQNKSENPKRQKELPLRSRYYRSIIDCDITTSGTPYMDLNEVCVIFVCTFDPFGKGRYRYTFQNTCVEDGELKLNDKVTTIFFNTTADLTDAPEKTRKLFQYIMTGKPSDEITCRIHKSVEKARLCEEWGREYMLTVVHDMDVRNEGREEGRKEGHAEGLAEGRKECQAEIDALKALLIANNIPFEQIK